MIKASKCACGPTLMDTLHISRNNILLLQASLQINILFLENTEGAFDDLFIISLL